MKLIDLNEIGIRICSLRKQKNYTQEQLAEMMDVSIQMISNLERGIKSIKIDNLVKLCEIFDVSTDYILLGNHSSKDLSELSQKIKLLSLDDYKMVEMLVNYCLTKRGNTN